MVNVFLILGLFTLHLIDVWIFNAANVVVWSRTYIIVVIVSFAYVCYIP